MDYTDEGQRLLQSLGARRSRYSHLDEIYADPVTGARIYVGNVTAAESPDIQEQHRIDHVVNCTDDLPNYFEGVVADKRYLRFHAADWPRRCNDGSTASVLRFVRPLVRRCSCTHPARGCEQARKRPCPLLRSSDSWTTRCPAGATSSCTASPARTVLARRACFF